MAHVESWKHGRVCVIEFGNPPVNGLAYAVRRELLAALDAAEEDPGIGAIVLAGRGDLFSAGADIREFGRPEMSRAPALPQLIDAFESCSKPVVAAIRGTCLGGGLELALGCHHRVASAQAPLGLPEVKLGLLPGAGGTQRLPRLVGIETALNMIVSGEPVPARALAKTALLDRVVDGDPLDAAVALAESLAAEGRPPRRTRDLRVTDSNVQALCQFARGAVRTKFPQYPAPLRCIDAVQASVGPFEEGIALERSLFLQLLWSPESQALRHAFFAERAASRVAGVPAETPVRPIRTAAVVGAGTMGSGIAMCFLDAGIPVRLVEANREALDRGVARIRETYEGRVSRGKLPAEERDRRLALLTPTLEYEQLGDADIVIEAVYEDMAVKEEVFRRLDAIVKQGAILATNTSTLDVDRIARATRRPADVLGLHFFSPANVMKLLEVVRGAQTAPDVLATAMKLAKTLRKTAVVARVCDGFIGNRMIEQYVRQALFLVEEGATPQQVDAALEAFGFAMGPFRMSDLAGNDIGWHIRRRRYVEKPHVKYSRLADRLCELGRFGQKTQAGWYDYRPGDRKAYPSRLVDELIARHRTELGIAARSIDDREIVDRLVYALVNEGARLLEEGIASRASDIDVVYLTGYGFPPWRGGPMFYADTVGLPLVVRRMRQLARIPQQDPDFWKPAPLLARLAEAGETFGSFSGAGA